MLQAVLWVPVAPVAGRSLLFDVEARSGCFFSLFFTPPLGGPEVVVLSQSQLCSLQSRCSAQVLLPLAALCQEGSVFERSLWES